MHEKHLQDLDQTFEQRAQRLVTDAKADAMSNSHGSQALKGYWHNAKFKEMAAVLAVKTGADFGKSLAAAAITAAGVSTAAMTFGIGPAIGLVVGLMVDKAVGEAKYQLQTKALRQGIDYAQTGDTIGNPALLEPGMAKILRKLDRVLRRHAQLAGGAGGVLASLRHARTAIRGWRAGQADLKDVFPAYFDPVDENTLDAEINHRLFELNYYAQMVGNYATAVLEGMAQERNNYVGYADLVYGHVVRQAHYTGHHENCDPMCCYGLPAVDFYARLNQLTAMHAADPSVRASTTLRAEQVSMAVERMIAQNRVAPLVDNTETLRANIQLAQGEAPPREQPESIGQKFIGFFKDKVTRTRDEEDVGRLGPVLGQGVSQLQSQASAVAGDGFLQDAGGTERVAGYSMNTQQGVISGQAALAQAGGSAIAESLGLFADEVCATARNILLKRAVLNKRDRAFNLMNAQMASRDEAGQALKEIAKGKDILSRSDRVAQKISWYIGKIERIEGEFKAKHLPRLTQNPTLAASSFASCRDAWNVARAVHYLFKQYEKAITFLVYLEVILVEMDARVAQRLGMRTGSIYKPGEPVPPRPRHMAMVQVNAPVLTLPTQNAPAPPPPAIFDIDDL